MREEVVSVNHADGAFCPCDAIISFADVVKCTSGASAVVRVGLKLCIETFLGIGAVRVVAAVLGFVVVVDDVDGSIRL